MSMMEQTEQQWDKLLNIKTCGRDDSKADHHNYPYEPTPYCVLERLANSGYIDKKSVVLDYGTGKGRVCFFLSWQTRCKSIGVDLDPRLTEAALKNKERAVSTDKTDFVTANATQYEVPDEVDRCYFFNPFSVEVLQKALYKIWDSVEEYPRKVQLFFYYPSDDYVAYLMTQHWLMFADEIDCRDLFPGDNERERILIFTIDPELLEVQ